ncbi:unnamed protein product [Rotaria sp. Silwood1]|nr:unnamed protein product [Rotaria sp. Silwood1]CAF4602497.1 unnamed protein product [Rotaria sp. Silwood1]
MATKKHRINSQDKINIDNYNVEHRLREAIAKLPIERRIDLDLSKIYQQLIESFYTYESHLANFVFDRDIHNIIYSLGFVPVSFLEKIIVYTIFGREKTHSEINELILAMRYHPLSCTNEREEMDAEHHLIHIYDFADIIIPKLLNNEYKAADEQYLLKCFKKLDQNNKNYLHKKLFVQTMSSMEDALDENESEDLLNFLIKNENLSIENLPDFFDYKRYIKHLLPQRHLIYLDLGVAK